MAEYPKTETSKTTEYTTYTQVPPPSETQTLNAVVTSEGRLTITLTDEQLGVYVWDGLLAAAPLIRDLLDAVILDQFGNLDPEEG